MILSLFRKLDEAALGLADRVVVFCWSRLSLSRTIEPSLVMPHVVELGKLFDSLELKVLRGTGSEVLEFLKRGEVELGIAAGIDEEWERLDSWPLFTEDFQLVVSNVHNRANSPIIELDELRQERLIVRTYCETTPQLLDLLRGRDFDVGHFHAVSAQGDLIALIEAGLGVALMPRSAATPATLMRIAVAGLELSRTVYLYGVAGRQRTPIAAAMMKMLRAADWSRFEANARP